MEVKFKKRRDQAYEGKDIEDNYYYMTANQEVVTCVLNTGEKGQGWTAEEAYNNSLINKMGNATRFKK